MPDEKFSKYFTLAEMTHSTTATREGLANEPTPAQQLRLRNLAREILDPLREAIGHPIIVDSGFRSPLVNAAVKGSKSSQHMKGEAADIRCPAIGQAALFRAIRESGLAFDQLIDEFGSWVHVSAKLIVDGFPRGEVLIARRGPNGKTIYSPVR